MRQITPYPLWIGHVGDGADVRRLRDAGVAALVDVALNEAPPHPPRDLIYCRFPLLDGDGNDAALLRLAVRTTALLLHDRTPTLVFCGSGMSRSPAVAAAALAVFGRRPPVACLEQIAEGGPHDVSPGLWQDILGACFAADAAFNGLGERGPSGP